VAEVVVNHRPRRHGRAKYGLSRTVGGGADLARLRAVMRQAIDPEAVPPRLYEVWQMLEPS
jgi:hypothetical protein